MAEVQERLRELEDPKIRAVNEKHGDEHGVNLTKLRAVAKEARKDHELAQIGIHHPDLRDRAVTIGEELGVLKDYPTPPNCTSPYAPSWIAEMVRRHEG